MKIGLCELNEISLHRSLIKSQQKPFNLCVSLLFPKQIILSNYLCMSAVYLTFIMVVVVVRIISLRHYINMRLRCIYSLCVQ